MSALKVETASPSETFLHIHHSHGLKSRKAGIFIFTNIFHPKFNKL